MNPATATSTDGGSGKPEAAEQLPETIPLPRLVLRICWVAVELILTYWLLRQAQPFFYQRF